MIIDECGNLSSTARSPRHFVLAATCIREIRQVQRIPRKARKKFTRKIDIGVELKHHAESEMVSTFILNSLASLDVNIYWVALRKSHEKDIQWYRTYEALSSILLKELIISEKAPRYHLFVDRISKKSVYIASYEAMVDRIVTAPEIGIPTPYISVRFVDSRSEPAMQVHDFIVGSIFRSLERNDDMHLEIIKDKIAFGKIVTMKDLFKHWHDEHDLQEN